MVLPDCWAWGTFAFMEYPGLEGTHKDQSPTPGFAKFVCCGGFCCCVVGFLVLACGGLFV